ncbi:Hint domain-containing protein [Streptomyces sp. NPDC002659]|uniref:Hint domain-containing protein n=1 Tax=Streptomyces sp. NPDC002659 TaxID=3364656 RepID=UPI00368CEC35
MSLVGVVRRVRRRVRRAGPRTEVRLLGLRKTQSGQSAIEYVGLVAVVAAIVGALLATGVGPTIAQELSTQVCRITGGENCGGGAPEAQGDGDPADDTQPASDDDPGAGRKPQSQIDYEKALKELQDAQAAEKSDQDKAIEAAKELAKILADELGITDALDCITKGDMGACTETLVNVLLSLIGGAVGKLAAKYGAPWKWKKAVELVRKLKKHGGDLYDGLTGLIKNRKRVSEAEKKLADAKRKLDAEKKDKPKDKDKDKDKPTSCPVHSFPPGTPVLLADGRRIPIESVSVGARVTVTDPVSGLSTVRRVTDTITTYDDKDFTRLKVTTSGGPAVLTATDTHPFWLTGRGRWAVAGEIVPGDGLRMPSGRTLKVAAVSRYTQRQTTHDLTVEGIHTYYVGVGAESALVHNNDGDCLSADEIAEARNPTVGEGDPSKFRSHFQRHKKLIEDALGTTYKKLKEDGPRFRQDIQNAIKDGTFELVGKGTLKKGEPEGMIYRGKGVTIVLRENGDFWTALESGTGLDTAIQITKKVPPKAG